MEDYFIIVVMHKLYKNAKIQCFRPTELSVRRTIMFFRRKNYLNYELKIVNYKKELRHNVNLL